MRLISPVLKHVVYPALARSGFLRRRAGAGPAVLTYHGILPAGYRVLDTDLDGSLVTVESFRQQLQLLKKQYSVISPEQFLLWCKSELALPPRAVLLTCDDGLRNTVTDMLPVLREESLSCLFFVTGASLQDSSSMLWYEELYLMFLAAPEGIDLEIAEIGFHELAAGRQEKRLVWSNLVKNSSRYQSSAYSGLLEQVRVKLGLSESWDAEYRQNSPSGSRFLMLSLAEVKRLAAEGMSIGAHTLAHPVLSQLPPEVAWREISESRIGLEKALDRPVWALAYPFGDPASITRREVEMAERAGFTCAFMNAGGGLGAPAVRFALPRVHVTASMSVAEFEAHISGFYRSVRQRFLPGEADATIGFGN